MEIQPKRAKRPGLSVSARLVPPEHDLVLSAAALDKRRRCTCPGPRRATGAATATATATTAAGITTRTTSSSANTGATTTAPSITITTTTSARAAAATAFLPTTTTTANTTVNRPSTIRPRGACARTSDSNCSRRSCPPWLASSPSCCRVTKPCTHTQSGNTAVWCTW